MGLEWLERWQRPAGFFRGFGRTTTDQQRREDGQRALLVLHRKSLRLVLHQPSCQIFCRHRHALIPTDPFVRLEERDFEPKSL